jgi:hypothetical protein
MTITEQLLQAPAGIFLAADADALEALEDGLDQHPDAAVRLVEGRYCRTKAALLAHFAERLQFPSYFGHNWDAFHDCLADFDPRPKPQFVLLIDDAEQVLAEAPGDLDILADSLVTLSAPSDEAHPDRGMKVVLHGPDPQRLPLLGAVRRLTDHVDMLAAHG